MSDVINASFAKYGNADGLAAEFATRKTKSIARYTKSQDTAKPQKKRPKIQHANDRPADNPRQLRYWAQTLPAGVSIPKANGGVPDTMSFAIQCAHCSCQGTAADKASLTFVP